MESSGQPLPPSPTSLDVAEVKKTNKLKTIWGIICLVAPTALLVISIIGYATLNFVFGGSWNYAHGYSDVVTPPSMMQSIGNIVLFIAAAFTVLTWLPGIIIGIILLATRKRI